MGEEFKELSMTVYVKYLPRNAQEVDVQKALMRAADKMIGEGVTAGTAAEVQRTNVTIGRVCRCGRGTWNSSGRCTTCESPPREECDDTCAGWAVFHTNTAGGYEILRCDNCERFASDQDALAHVITLETLDHRSAKAVELAAEHVRNKHPEPDVVILKMVQTLENWTDNRLREWLRVQKGKCDGRD